MHFLKSHLLTIIELVIRKVAYVLYVIPPSSAILTFLKYILYISTIFLVLPDKYHNRNIIHWLESVLFSHTKDNRRIT